MIRFIDMRKQDTGYNFAFFDTTRNKFCEFGGEQAWDFAEGFINSFNSECSNMEIERFLSLMPDWA